MLDHDIIWVVTKGEVDSPLAFDYRRIRLRCLFGRRRLRVRFFFLLVPLIRFLIFSIIVRQLIVRTDNDMRLATIIPIFSSTVAPPFLCIYYNIFQCISIYKIYLFFIFVYMIMGKYIVCLVALCDNLD